MSSRLGKGKMVQDIRETMSDEKRSSIARALETVAMVGLTVTFGIGASNLSGRMQENPHPASWRLPFHRTPGLPPPPRPICAPPLVPLGC